MHRQLRLSLCFSFFFVANTLFADEAPLGVWFWADQGPASRITIAAMRSDNKLQIKLGDKIVPLTQRGNKIAFDLGEQGSFEGTTHSNHIVTGTWLQPSAKYFYSTMATQVAFAFAEDAWETTEIQLQPRPFHLFLDIFEEQGDLYAALRNPERNDILGATRFRVEKNTQAENQWLLEAGSGDRSISIPIQLSGNHQLELAHFQANGTVRLSKATPADLAGYYPRPRNTSSISAVQDRKDGWRIRQPADSGFDTQILNSLVSKLATQDPRSKRPILVHSLLVAHQGHLVFEEYFFDHKPEDVHDSRSMAKVFGSVLVGAAIQQGYAMSVKHPPLPGILAAHDQTISEADKHLTLEHFLTYTSGLDASEDEQSPGSEDRMWNQSENFWLFTAKLNKKHAPGTVYAYSSASANMVGASIEQITGQSVNDFFHAQIAKPLNFSPYHWNLTPDGQPYLGGGVYLTPRDALKIGALYAQKGEWYGKRIIPEDWITESTTAKIAISPETTGLSEEVFANVYFPGEQAYIWRVDTVRANDRAYRMYLATGNGGQIVAVVPELELAVGINGGNYRMGYVWGRWPQQIIGDYLIPALTKS